MAGDGDSSPSPSSPPKHSRSPDDVQPDASPKRRKRHHHRHPNRRSHRHRSPESVSANRMEEDEVEEGEILDAAAAAAMDVDADSQASLAPEAFGNGDGTDSNSDATKLHAPVLLAHSSSNDERKSVPSTLESESGGILSSDAEDIKGYEQSQIISKSPLSRTEKGRKHRDGHHTSSSKDSHSKDHSRISPYPRHHSEAHAKDQSRSRGKGAEANGSRASPRDDSDPDISNRNEKSGRHSIRSRESERERSSSRVTRDVDRHGSSERYRDDRRHNTNVLDRDKVDSREATHSRHRERSSSRSRSERRESAHFRDEGRDRERRSGSSRHKDHERRDSSKDRHRESDRVDREKVREDRDREWRSVKGSENRRAGEARDKVSNPDRHRDSTHSKYSSSDGYKERPRSRDKARDVDHKSRRPEEMKDSSFREEDEEEYQEKIEQQLAMQEEDDPEKIKEEARRRKEAIMAKYRQQQLQKQQVESVPSSNNEEERTMGRDETALLKESNDDSYVANDEAENKHDSSEVFSGEVEFTVGKSPASNNIIDNTGALGNERGVSGLGEGTPKSERSADMFCDDIFGESPAAIRKPGKDDGMHIERNALHDNWDDADGYYTHRLGELLDGRYEITAAHGKGVFSTVVRAKDLKAGKDDPEEVAIKIIRNNETMYKAGKQEVSILEKLASADREDKRHCVRFISSFMYRNHLCLVFESLNMNLREVLKKFGRNIGLKLTAVRAYSKQLFIALKHLKNCKVLHCDIKPDNMLVNEAKNVLKLCDFGNAMLAGMNEVTPYLVSRFYRAPEIILGLPYDHPLDMWSVGCCMYELYTGKVLFPGPSNNDMLRLHMELKGPFPKKMLRKGAFTMQHFDQDLNFLSIEEDPVTKKAVRRVILNIKPKDIGSLITNFPGEDPKMLATFKDLLDKIFVLDPEKRITVSQALSHPFITGK
ncbi:hypothetical protein EJB05_00014 [Eragrostis curvula]|uniref:Serine/threonine-protein kinase PRP4 homolog n=1 Tax=Eragrostis curvula TaxID=38414 RepID=A0A5J9WKX3_9POAL|nr:hypothetical protein EJB05_00014 [Eragrostis curvula]